MSGLAAPSFTTTPTPTRAKFFRLPAMNFPFFARSSTAVGVSTARSKPSPPSIRLMSAPTVSFSTVTLCPVCCSNAGSSASSTCLKAPAVSTLISAAPAPRGAAAATSMIARLNTMVLIASSITQPYSKGGAANIGTVLNFLARQRRHATHARKGAMRPRPHALLPTCLYS